MRELEQELIDYISRSFLEGNSADLTPETPLLQLRILDSITLQELHVFVEHRFGVKLDDGTASPADYANIAALARIIAARRPTGTTESK